MAGVQPLTRPTRTSRSEPPALEISRADKVMNVRRPECDEQPFSPNSTYRSLNQLTTLLGVIAPPLCERMTGPVRGRPCSLFSLSKADLSSWWIGSRRARPFLAMPLPINNDAPTRPLGSSTMLHSSPAISQARSPALKLSRTIAVFLTA